MLSKRWAPSWSRAGLRLACRVLRPIVGLRRRLIVGRNLNGGDLERRLGSDASSTATRGREAADGVGTPSSRLRFRNCGLVSTRRGPLAPVFSRALLGS